MDDTNTATSSSAAAVADGASAAANTKTLETATPAIKSSSYVKILIKASNQQYDDQVIESDFSWTVKRLKSHLSIVYPSKPPAAEQKLIYSGQLLNDNHQLKDIIRSYKDVYTQNHIIHLVYTPKNLQPSAPSNPPVKSTKPPSSAESTAIENMTAGNGLRQRHQTANSSPIAPGNVQTPIQQVSPEQMTYYSQYLQQAAVENELGPCVPMTQNTPTIYGQLNMHALAMQNTAVYSWMQQVYSQYMEQCLRVSNAVNDANDGNIIQDGVAGTTPAGYSTIPQYPFLPNFSPAVIPPVTQATQMNAPAPPSATAQVNQPQQQEQHAQAQVAAPRFPNLPQDEPDNRDWLDNIFLITRFALFLTVLYFNSSPLRCLAVVIIAGGIYLYHIGVFRFRHERNNNNLDRDNNAAQNAAVDQIRQGVDQQHPQREWVGGFAEHENNVEGNAANRALLPLAGDENDLQELAQQSTNTNSENPNSEETNNNGSLISTLRIFVVTFFTSLLPETPPAV